VLNADGQPLQSGFVRLEILEGGPPTTIEIGLGADFTGDSLQLAAEAHLRHGCVALFAYRKDGSSTLLPR